MPNQTMQHEVPPAFELAQRLFITGGSGYVGRNLIRHFVAKSVEVVALARTPHSAELVRSLGAVPLIGDLHDATLADGMQGCQMLIHAAADTNHGRGTPEQWRTNLEGTQNIFNCAALAGIARAVYLSSESVLLDGTPLVNATEAHPFPRRPAGIYSASKGAAERAALASATPSLAVMAVRPRMVWGRDDTTALPQLVAMAASGQLAFIGGGDYLTSTTHIANLCTGIELALRQGRSGEAYFITDGEPTQFRSIVSNLLETQGIQAPEKTVPRWLLRFIATVGDALGTVSNGRIIAPLTMQAFATSAVEVTVDITKARRELGYAPVISQADGLAELRALHGLRPPH